MAVDRTLMLARQLELLKKGQRDKGSTPQLGRSSIEDGKIDDYDINGQLKQIIGKQPDGTNTVTQVNGPIPPAPSQPIATGGQLAVAAHWDGAWAAGAVAPLDLARIDVHLTGAPGENPLLSPAVATIASGGWGEARFPATAATYYVVLVAWTTSGKYALSSPSDPVVVNDPPPPSDGSPPATAPVVELQSSFNAIQLLIAPPPNTDPITGYTVYVNGEAALTQDSTSIAVGLDADGEGLPYDSDTEIRVSAWDTDGESPLSAAMLARPKKLGGNEILEKSITGAEIADFGIAVQKLKSNLHMVF